MNLSRNSLMFHAAVAFVMALTATPSFAQNAFGRLHVMSADVTASASAAALPSSLRDTMKAMKQALKAIAAEDASKNADNAKAADQFTSLTLHAKMFTPDGASAADKAKFDQLLDQTADAGKSLAAAFRAGDNAKAVKLMAQLDAFKKEGHGEFK